MFCKFCGTQLPDNAKFCGNCGNQLGQPEAPVNQAPQMKVVPPATEQPYTTANNPTPQAPPYKGTPAGKPAQKIKVKKKYNLGNLIVWLGCILGIASLFTTYATASLLGYSESVCLMDTEDGMIFLVIIAIVAILCLFKLNIVCAIGSLITIFFVNMEYQNVNDSYYSGMVEFGMGSTLLWIGAILMLLGAIAAFVLATIRKQKDREAAMKATIY